MLGSIKLPFKISVNIFFFGGVGEKYFLGHGGLAHLATARPGWEAALPLREDSKETETASTPSFVIAGSKIL